MGDGVRWTFRHDLPGESDEQLTERARRGDKSAFGELYRRHRKAAESTAWCVLRSKSDADDAVSEAFTGVLSALGNGRGPRDNFRGYLLACVRNACRVRRPPSVPMSEDQLERWSPVLEDPERYVEADTVARAFSSLAPRWQHTLWLTEVEQRPAGEVSEQLELSPNATAALSHRARQAFATAYLAEHVAAVTDRDCARVAPQLAGYVRNQLSDAQLIGLERHLVSCTHCSAAVAQLRDVNASLRSLVPVAPEAFAGATLATETSLVATSIGGASVGLPGVGVLVKGLVAVLLVAPVLSTDIPRHERRSGQSSDQILQVRESADLAAASAGGGPDTTSTEQPVAETSAIVETAPIETVERPAAAEQSVGVDVQPTVTVPIIGLDPITTLVDGVVDDVLQPLVGGLVEPMVETLDEALAVMGLGTTGETVAMLRTFVPLLDGPLLGELVDELLEIASLNSGMPTTSTTAPTSTSAVVDPGGPEATLPNSPGVPSVSVTLPPTPIPPATPLLPEPPAVTLPPIPIPPIVLPTISVPPISLPINVPPITLPVISVPPITLPNLGG